ncbi:uncharacterized protein CTRU02_207950 [Colletotrichum truncatum]|uniref:Uncharacterized protein n=1 Tax=Colletotrichum truncatum TaxID=5467 RepID=A0ACC3Z2B7_COLTU
MSSDSSAEDMPIDFLNLVTDHELASSTSALQPAEWAVEPNLLRSLDLSGQFRDYGSFTPVDRFNTSSVMPGTQLVNSGPFSLRITTGSGQILVPLLLRILQSYPFMLLRKETFPPFMNPLLYSWAESGKTPSQQTLINCVSIVHMFKAQREANKSFMWTVIKLEQERIAAGVSLSIAIFDAPITYY